MHIENLLLKKEFSADKPVKKDLLISKKFNIAIVCLEKDQEIPPHPEPYAVFFLVLEGKGIFTSSQGKYELRKNSSIYLEADEMRGIKCVEQMIVLGVQDGHKKTKST